MSDLPRGWGRFALGDVCSLITDGSHHSPASVADGLPYVTVRDVRDGRIDLDGCKRVSPEDFKMLANTGCQPYNGDVLFSKDGTVGRAALVDTPQPFVVLSSLAILRPRTDLIDSQYLALALAGPEFQAQALGGKTGTALRRITLRNLRPLLVNVPPLDEQRRIVAILEDHLGRLDAASASLRKTEALVQTGISAARQQAVVGGLHPLGDVAEVVGGIQKQPKRAPKSNPAPFLRVANVTSDGLDLSEVHEIELFEGELAKYRLLAGDLLVVEGNGSANQIGRAATWHGEVADCVHQNHLIRVRPGEGLDPAYLELVWNAPSTRRSLSAVASSSSGLHTLSVSKLKALMIPIPDIQTQIEHVARYVEMREQMSRAESSVRVSLGHSTSLRRSLLQAAFSGQLTRESISV